MLALGIAGNTAIFSMINAIFIRPFPYEQPDRLVDLDTTAPQWNLEYVGITYPDFLAWREGNSTFASMGILDSESVNMMSDEGARRLSILRVSYDLVETLRLAPVLGRSFTLEDEILGGPNVAMVVSGFWHEYFGGDTDITGRTITLDGVSYEIIGVLPEILLLAVVGGVIGLLLGIWGISALDSVFPIDLPPWATLNADLLVMGFSFAVCLLAAILFGLLPALRSTKGGVAEFLIEGTDRSSASTGTKRLMRAFVAIEVALALGLLVTASLLVQAYRNVGGIDPGFEPEGILAFRLDLLEADYDDGTELRTFHNALIERLEALPGVESAAAASSIPLRGHSGYFFEAEGAQPPEPGRSNPVTLVRFVTLDYPGTVGMRLKVGRQLSEADTLAVVVNETFARHHWGEEDPIGRRIRPAGAADMWIDVVGLAYDVKHYGLDEEMIPGVYIPMAVQPERDSFFLLRKSIDPASLASAARATVQELDPALRASGADPAAALRVE